jgi:hypothetical protein
MTDDNVAHLRTVPAATVADTEDSYLARIRDFVKERELLTEYDDSDVELDNPTLDERRLGPLTPFERECFVIGQLLAEVVRSELIEIEATGTDTIAKIMREKKVSAVIAAQLYSQSQEVPEETRILVNQCALTQALALTAYEWSVRTRYNVFDSRLIVRAGFVVYRYG